MGFGVENPIILVRGGTNKRVGHRTLQIYRYNIIPGSIQPITEVLPILHGQLQKANFPHRRQIHIQAFIVILGFIYPKIHKGDRHILRLFPDLQNSHIGHNLKTHKQAVSLPGNRICPEGRFRTHMGKLNFVMIGTVLGYRTKGYRLL